MPSVRTIVVGSRGSRLARAQTEQVLLKLKAEHPERQFRLQTIVTTGDADSRTSLDRIGIDVFVKELEQALLAGEIDLAIHSLKDVPVEMPPGLSLMASPQREDPRDVLVARTTLAGLPPGARVGTGSLRRTVQLKKLRPDIVAGDIRGNIDTRLKKVYSGDFDGVITAAAALSRLGWLSRVSQYLPLEVFLPAAGQGALVIETRTDDEEMIELAAPICHVPTWECVRAERSFLGELGGGCRAPIGALATRTGPSMRLDGMVTSIVTGAIIRDSLASEELSPEELGAALARKMLALGAGAFIAEARLNEVR